MITVVSTRAWLSPVPRRRALPCRAAAGAGGFRAVPPAARRHWLAEKTGSGILHSETLVFQARGAWRHPCCTPGQEGRRASAQPEPSPTSPCPSRIVFLQGPNGTVSVLFDQEGLWLGVAFLGHLQMGPAELGMWHRDAGQSVLEKHFHFFRKGSKVS